MSRSRNEFTGKVKVAAFDRAGSCCEDCGVRIRPGNGPEFDHIVADAIGGGNDIGNCRVLCIPCHGVKTATKDIPMIAKVKRVARKHIGAETKTKRRIAGGRWDKKKAKIGGGWEWRE